MNLIDMHINKPILTSTDRQVYNKSFQKKDNSVYQDPLRKWPLKGLAYSNELGAVIGGISPKLGTALWVPALMYFGADIYDKYKNDNTEYSPSKKRGVKEAIFQAMASVILPTTAVKTGQKTISFLNRFTKEGLTTQSKQSIIEKSLSFMESKSLHTFEKNPSLYAEGFKQAISTMANDAMGDFKVLPRKKKVLSILNPIKAIDSIAFAKQSKLESFAEKQAYRIMEMRADLMKNQKPKHLSKKLFKKFQEVQGEYQKNYPQDRYMGKAAKSILKDYHNSQIFKNKMIKTAGGFIALALLAKPIDNFVEHIVIKKTVEPSLDYLSKGINKRIKKDN